MHYMIGEFSEPNVTKSGKCVYGMINSCAGYGAAVCERNRKQNVPECECLQMMAADIDTRMDGRVYA